MGEGLSSVGRSAGVEFGAEKKETLGSHLQDMRLRKKINTKGK